MAVTAPNRSDFRNDGQASAAASDGTWGSFVQGLKPRLAAGLVTLGHVALDRTKVAANASRHKAMSDARMRAAEMTLADEVAASFTRAEGTDAREDRAHGTHRRGDEMPDLMADEMRRLGRIRAAEATLEAEAKAPPAADDDGLGSSSGMAGRTGRAQHGPHAKPPDKAQRNFTNPDSRILPHQCGVVQGYNAQIAVDGAHQSIISQRVQTSHSDGNALKPLLGAARAMLRANPKEVSADTRYRTNTNLAHRARRRIKGFLAPGRARHSHKNAAGRRLWGSGSRIAAMATKLKRAGRRNRYRLQKQSVEPVFGQIKQARGFRQFLLRGLEKVRGEWAMVCTAHNLLKLANATR